MDATLLEEIVGVIASQGMVERDAILPTATIETLGLDSIEVVMILNGVEEKFDVYIPMDGGIAEARNLAELVGILAKPILENRAAKPAKDVSKDISS